VNRMVKYTVPIASIIVVVLIFFAILNFFFQQEVIKLVGLLGWDRLQGFVSGPWWNSIPTLILALGIFLTLWQIVEGRKSTNAQIAMDLFKELREDETVEKLHIIYNRAENDERQLSPIAQNNIRHILDRFEVLGILVEKGIVDKDLAIHAYGGASALRCWYKLHHYISQMSDEIGPWKINYEIYTRRCLEYFIKNKIPVKLSANGNNIDILKELQKPAIKPRNRKEMEKTRK
jgi:hypothetical protein